MEPVNLIENNETSLSPKVTSTLTVTDKHEKIVNDVTEIPKNVPLTNIKLPSEWVLYLYDKQLFKKMVKQNIKDNPNKILCTLSTVNDLIYILQLMEVKMDTKLPKTQSENKLNLDANDYILMRKGIEPIWEDPKNSNGGTFTAKINHNIGYNIWSDCVMYMIGESLSHDSNHINGISVSYIIDSSGFNNISHNHIPNNSSRDSRSPRSYNNGPGMKEKNNFTRADVGPSWKQLATEESSSLSLGMNANSYTFIKIWDAKPDRTKDEFIDILPIELIQKIKNESLMYTRNNAKKDYNEKNIISKLARNQRSFKKERGRGFGGNKQF